MWAHRPWVGRFYPESTRPGSELRLYASLCNAVEGNTTFYAEPSTTTVDRWKEQTPDTFRFLLKVPRTVTHDRRLHDVAEPMRSFLNRVEPLGDRLGPIHVQLPPGFGPDGLEVLARFVRRLPADWGWVLELRHVDWFNGSIPQRHLDDLIADREIGRVVLDTRPLYAAAAASTAAVEERANKPRLPILTDVMGPSPIIRVIGQDSAAGTLDGLRAWLPHVAEWIGEGRKPYLFVHQPENLDSPAIARAIHSEARELIATLDPLPDPAPVQTQPPLFGSG